MFVPRFPATLCDRCYICPEYMEKTVLGKIQIKIEREFRIKIITKDKYFLKFSSAESQIDAFKFKDELTNLKNRKMVYSVTIFHGCEWMTHDTETEISLGEDGVKIECQGIHLLSKYPYGKELKYMDIKIGGENFDKVFKWTDHHDFYYCDPGRGIVGATK